MSDPNVKNDMLRDSISATGADGYRAIVSWGEIDPDLGHEQVLLATSEDGKSLAATGPHIHLASADDEG